tara:strand:+ start:104040 stop:105302 length:1263 start_codon:yes stop_codon:yes gene_type:complete
MFPRKLFGSPSTFTPYDRSRVIPKPRVVFCYVPNGVNIHQWVPAETGSDFSLSKTLVTLQEFRNDFTVISGLGHPNCAGGHSGADTWLTGADLSSMPGKDYANTQSIDQRIADQIGSQTRFPSLQISDGSGTGSALHSHTLSFDRNGIPLPAENRPRRLFDRLFVPAHRSSRRAAQRRFEEKRSILDDVASEANALSRKLGPADRTKLNEYLASVRETERRVQRQAEWIDVPKPKVSDQGLLLNSRPGNAQDRSSWIDVMLEITYLAFVTDMTRVVTFQWSREAGGFGPGGENHHEYSHHGGDEGMLEKLAGIDRAFLQRLGYFLSLLQGTDEGGRSVLDHTMVVYGSGMNSGDRGEHSPKNLPLLVAGGSAWGLKHGQHLSHDPEDHPPLANLLLTVAQKMGVHTDEFQDATGTLAGLA